MGVVFSILFAIGLILIRQAADHVDLDPGCVLYGNIVQIPLDALVEDIPPAARNLAFVFALNVLFVGLLYKELRVAAFDPELATTLGVNANVMHYALMIMVAITTVANFESVGSILVIAMLIVPPVTAHLLTDRLGAMILVALVIATFSAVVGHLAALYGPGMFGMDVAANTSAMMATVAGAVLFLTILFAPEHGLVARVYHRAKLTSRIIRQDLLGLLYRWEERAGQAGGAMPRRELLTAVGQGVLSQRALARLRGLHEIDIQKSGEGETVRLTDTGRDAASRLVGAHRLWEAYLDKHFQLAPDHLHEPAHRMEHFITPALREELRDQLTNPSQDPHGTAIPPEADHS
jgi:manganese/zinc/iron transport system permease protein